MSIWDRLRKSKEELRSSPENPAVPLSASNFAELMGWTWAKSSSGVSVSVETALGVPAVWSAVNFMSGTLAGLPCNVFRRTSKGREKLTGGLQSILHDAINDEMSSFAWRKALFDAVFTDGRAFAYIERNGAGKVANLWPMDQAKVKVIVDDKGKHYVFEPGAGRPPKTYNSNEVIDIAFMLKSDMITHRSPIMSNRETIGLAIAATNYGSRFFQNGGVPPFVIEGPMTSPAGLKRSSDDLDLAVKQNAKEPRLALALPAGHTIKALGVDPEKSQLVELKRFLIEEIARIYSLPPVFLQDLTHGTYSNTEQQDLFFVKHTLTRWAEQFEQELNLKLFGRSNSQYVEMNMDGLLRGDFKTRMDGYAQAIMNGVMMPNEAREKENMETADGGDQLFIQGATIPLANAGQAQPTGVAK